MSEILAAILGALLAGGLQTVLAVFDRRRLAESVLTALASEVDSICRLVRHQGYLEAVTIVAGDIQKGMWNGTTYIIDIRSNYFSVYEGLVSQLGQIQPRQASKIVNFYAYCKSAIDSTRPDGPHAGEPNSVEAGQNMVSVAALLHAALTLGDEIVQFPRQSIHDLVLVDSGANA